VFLNSSLTSARLSDKVQNDSQMNNTITTIITMSFFMVLFMAMADLNAYRTSTVLPFIKSNGYVGDKSQLLSFWNFAEIYREYQYAAALRPEPKADRITRSLRCRIALIIVSFVLLVSTCTLIK